VWIMSFAQSEVYMIRGRYMKWPCLGGALVIKKKKICRTFLEYNCKDDVGLANI
jgi:hypothetical protein